jgi:predicted MFS family arabinose efflux permease
MDSGTQDVANSGKWVKDMNYQDASGNYMFLCGPIYGPDGGIAGGIEIGIETSSLEDSIFTLSKNLMVRSLLMLALVLFLVSEALEYAPAKLRPEGEDDGEIPSGIYRPVTFLIFLGFNLSTAFLPNYALRIGGSFMGLSPNVSAVLPITACDVLLTAAPLITPYLLSRLNFRLSFSLSFILCAAGHGLCATATTIGKLIAGMGALGLGAGIIFTLLQTCAASRKNADERAFGFSDFTSSSFSGINCGIMIGGIIAVNFSQEAVFFCGSFMWIFIMTVLLILSGKKAGTRTANTPADSPREPVPAPAPARTPFAFPGAILAFLLLSFFPYTLYSGFIYYLVPVFGGQAGMSDAEISLVFIFFGVGIMFFGSKMASLMRGKTDKISYVLRLALVMELCGILCFAVYQSISSMVLAVLILGGACGIGDVYFPLYLTEMPEAKTLKEGGAMAILNFTENMAVAAGPMLFSFIFYSGSLWYFALAAWIFLSSMLYNNIRRRMRVPALR